MGKKSREELFWLFLYLLPSFIYLGRAKYFLTAPSQLPFVQGENGQTWTGSWKLGQETWHVSGMKKPEKRKRLKIEQWGESLQGVWDGRLRTTTSGSNKLLRTELAGRSCQGDELCQLFNYLQLWKWEWRSKPLRGGSGEAVTQKWDRLIELFGENLIDLFLS